MSGPVLFRTKQIESKAGEGTRSPTKVQFTAYEQMFGFFNRRLFGGVLPACLLNFSRKSKTYGFFAPQRWQHENAKEVRHEISLNPASLRIRKPIEVASTLVHEMVHLWQQEFGRPSRTGYHNAEWAAKMDEVGLTPSSTAAPGGERVGQAVSHYIAPGGRFARPSRQCHRRFCCPGRARSRRMGRKRSRQAATRSSTPAPGAPRTCGASRVSRWCAETAK